jgi:ABC-type multidrug transport system ATPase subunit
MECVLKTFDLGKRFGNRWAARGIDLEVNRGDIFCFLGPNGAGKSTTIRMILTLLRPTTGSIQLFGRDPHKNKNRREALSRVCGIVEKPDFYLYLSAYKNLELLGSMTRRIKGDEIMDALERVGLKARAHDKVRTFSHGMKQRLGIAQALLTKPELIILDEPTTGLDPQGMKDVRELIRKLSQEEMTIFLSSHLLSEIEQVATRMAVVHRGEMVAQGSVSELLAGEATDYALQVSPIEKALKIMQPIPWVKVLSFNGNMVELRLEPGRASELNKLLVTNQVEVLSLYPRRTLEDFFLKVTKGTPEI